MGMAPGSPRLRSQSRMNSLVARVRLPGCSRLSTPSESSSSFRGEGGGGVARAGSRWHGGGGVFALGTAW